MMDLYDNTPEIEDCTLTFAGPLGIHNLVQRAAQATAPANHHVTIQYHVRPWLTDKTR